MKKIIFENTKIIAIATILSLAVGVASAWTAPTQPAPNGNIEAPLNVSASGQSKKGNLIIYGLNSLDQPVANALTLLNGDLKITNGKLDVKNKIAIYRMSTYCTNAGSLVTESTCGTIVSNTTGGQEYWDAPGQYAPTNYYYYDCNGNPGNSSPATCQNTKVGYMFP